MYTYVYMDYMTYRCTTSISHRYITSGLISFSMLLPYGLHTGHVDGTQTASAALKAAMGKTGSSSGLMAI